MTRTDLIDPIAAARALIEPLTGYTPGPWKQGQNNPDRVSKGGEYIANCNPTHQSHPRTENNARLIAAAPDLRAMVATLASAVQRMADEIDRLTSERDAAIKALSQAAKAKGQAEGKLAASELPGVVDRWKARAERAEAERDQALARAAAAAMDMRERSASVTVDLGPRYDGRPVHYHIPENVQSVIRALPIDPDAQKALDNLLAKAREQGDYYEGIQEGYRAGIKEAADIVNKNRDISGWVSHDAILALLNDGGRDD